MSKRYRDLPNRVHWDRSPFDGEKPIKRPLGPFPQHKPTVRQLAALAAGRAKRHQPREPKFCPCGRAIKPGPNYAKVKYCSPTCSARGKEMRENGRRCGLNHGRHAIARYRADHPEWRAEVGKRSRARWEAFREADLALPPGHEARQSGSSAEACRVVPVGRDHQVGQTPAVRSSLPRHPFPRP